MNLTNYLIEGLLPEEEKKKVVAVYGGGFKPPTSGHFEVVKQALKENPEIDEFIILIGGKPRNGITPDESILIWDIYKTYLPFKVEVKYTSTPPIKGIYNYAKEHPDEEVLFIIGAREGNEEDFKDIASRTTSLDKYPNLNLRTIVTQGGVSGTAARNASKISLDKFKRFVPSELSDGEVEQVYNIVADKIQENITEGKQVGTLYHYTSADGLKGILQSNSIRASKEYYLGNDIYFVSFTRNKNFHKKGSAFDVKIDYRITLDGDKLSNKYKIKPFAYIPGWNYKDNWEYEWLDDEPESVVRDFFQGTGDYDEQEERISFKKPGGSITNIKDYILKIDKVSELTEGRKKQKTNESVDFISLEKILDDMFEDLGIDINFTRHFKERVIERGLTEEDIIELMKKIYNTHGDEVADLGKNENRVFTHLRRLVDIAAINKGYGEDYLKDLVLKTAYKRNSPREPEFKTNRTSPKLRVNEISQINQGIDIKKEITKLTKYMIDKGMNIKPLPKLIFKHGDVDNAQKFLGKTAYYDPNKQHIVLYTEGRHPKDIVRSFAHEMIHHIQNLEGRLGDITTTNTQEDDHLNDIEAEANLKGTMTFRNWTDSLNENTNFKPLVDKYKKLLDLQDWKITLQPIQKNQVQYSDDVPEKDKYYIGVERNNDFKTAIIYYDRDLTDEDVLHELLHLKLPTFSEDNINALTDKILKKNSFPDLKVQNESIVDEKIECDNCGWSWNIVDGGDDLFICHKCGHDNGPINEKKNKDPFGLNAYARELAMGLEENEKVMSYKIYCDMDGVLVDFERGYKKLTGIDLKGEYRPGGEDFWKPIEQAGVKYWASLKWMPDGKQLWDYIKPYKPELLSAPSKNESSKIGKYVWVKNNLPGTKLILRYASRKKELATPKSILIDDRQANIDQWEAAGGIGILHTDTNNTIKKLKQLGYE
jgi:hypothetical protein